MCHNKNKKAKTKAWNLRSFGGQKENRLDFFVGSAFLVLVVSFVLMIAFFLVAFLARKEKKCNYPREKLRNCATLEKDFAGRAFCIIWMCFAS